MCEWDGTSEVTEGETTVEATELKIDWKHKLTSRKFWAAVVTFVSCILIAFNVDDLTIEQVGALITAAATVIAYIIGEGLVDAAAAKAPVSYYIDNREDN